MRSFAIVIRRAYFEAKKRRKYAKNVVVNRSGVVSVDKSCSSTLYLFQVVDISGWSVMVGVSDS